MRLAATGTDAPTGQPTSDRAGWLGFAAAPTFALMASFTALGSSGICSAVPSWAPVDDMALMYFLMSLFHLPPWLRLLSRRLAAPRRPN